MPAGPVWRPSPCPPRRLLIRGDPTTALLVSPYLLPLIRALPHAVTAAIEQGAMPLILEGNCTQAVEPTDGVARACG
jgi:hypothetical protein